MRISSALLLTLLAGCGQRASAPAAKDDRSLAGDPIECASGAGAFERSCTVERTRGPAGLLLTVRRADGGFRRLQVTQDGRGVVAADGALPATVKIVSPDLIEVAVGDDRYRLPATAK